MDAPPVLQSAEEAFYDVAPGVGLAIKRKWLLPRAGRRDDGFGASVAQPEAEGLGIVGTVCEQASGGADRTDDLLGDDDIRDVARRQEDSDRSAAIIGQGMDLRPRVKPGAGCSAAPRASDRFRLFPLFAPEAER